MRRIVNVWAVGMIALGVVACQPSSPVAAVDQKLVVYVKNDGTVWLEDKSVGLDELDARLAQLAQRDPRPAITFDGDLSASRELFAEVGMTLAQHGFGKFGLIAEREPPR